MCRYAPSVQFNYDVYSLIELAYLLHVKCMQEIINPSAAKYWQNPAIPLLIIASRMTNCCNILYNDSLSFLEIRRKWKEELDQELKREVNYQLC
jgi:hypothetical protein